MKPYKLIQDAHQVCEDLKYNLKFSKNKARDTKRINTLLRALKGFDDMLVHKYKVNEIDKLICYIIEDYLMRFQVECNNEEILDMHQIINKIKMTIGDESYNAISRLSTVITAYEKSRLVIKGEYEKFNLPKKEKTTILVKKLLIDLKTDMQWTSQK